MILADYGPAEVQSGIYPDLSGQEAPLWRDGADVLFRNGGARAVSRSALYRRLPDQSRVQTIAQTSLEELVDGVPRRQTRVYYATAEQVFLVSQFAKDAVVQRPLLEVPRPSVGRRWHLIPYGSFLFATNGVDTPYIWRNTGYMEELFSPQTAKLLTRLGPHLIAANIQHGPTDHRGNEVAWSDGTDVSVWGADTTNTAGSLILRDLESDVIAVEPLGGAVAVYGTDSMGLLSYIGGTFVFGFQRLFDNIGAVGPRAVVSVGYRNFGMSRQGVWVTDGSTVDYVDEPAVRSYLQDNVDWSRGEEIIAFRDEENQQVIFYFPQGDEERGVAYNYENRTWSRLQTAYEAVSPRRVFARALVACGGELKFYGEGKGSIDTSLTTKPLSLGHEERFKVVRALKFSFRGGLEVQVGYSDTDEPYVFTGTEACFPCKALLYLPERECGYLTLRFLTPDGEDWQLNGFAVEGMPQGDVL